MVPSQRFVFESRRRNKEELNLPSKDPLQLSTKSSGAVGGLVKSVTDFIRPDFACLSGDSAQCLFSFKPPPPALLRLPLPPQHPSAVTWWTQNELFAASASSSSFFFGWLMNIEPFFFFFLFLFFKFGDDLTLLYPFWIRPSGRFSRSISS